MCETPTQDERTRHAVRSTADDAPDGVVLPGEAMMGYRTVTDRFRKRQVLTRHIVEQAEKYGLRCPATQKPLNAFTSVLIKVHSPKPEWCVVDGYAYDCATEDGTLDKIRRETMFRVEVIDGRAL